MLELTVRHLELRVAQLEMRIVALEAGPRPPVAREQMTLEAVR
jgi:hypothetical protein